MAEITTARAKTSSVWPAAGQQRRAREAAWAKLERLLAPRRRSHRWRLQQSAPQRMPSATGRQLLDDPDPVTPLIDAARAALLRARSCRRAEQLVGRSTRAHRRARSWRRVDQLGRRATGSVDARRGRARRSADSPDVSTRRELLAALDATPLSALAGTSRLVPSRQDQARAARRQDARARTERHRQPPSRDHQDRAETSTPTWTSCATSSCSTSTPTRPSSSERHL